MTSANNISASAAAPARRRPMRLLAPAGGPEQLRQAMYYLGIIVLFAIGAGIGGNLSANYGIHMIWVSCGLLIVSFLLMFLDIEARRSRA